MSFSGLAPRRLCGDLDLHPLGIGSGTSRWAAASNPRADGRMLDGLRRAVELGVTFMDTADSHGDGHAERMIGKVLREYPGHRIQVASKTGRLRGTAPHPYAGPRLRHQLEQTLENLYLEELAVYTLDSYDFGLGDQYLDPVVEQLHAMRDLGQIRAIGLRGPDSRSSVHLMRRFRELFDRIRPDILWTQVNGLLPAAVLDNGEDIGAFTLRQGVGLLLASPLAHGLLAGGCARGRLTTPRNGSREHADLATAVLTCGLGELADRFGQGADSLVRLALRSRLQGTTNAVVIVGIGDEQQVEQYVNCLGDPLSAQELAEVEDVFARIRIGLRYPADGLPVAEATV
jgi:aryl-alcohol dehydrogenase-like predicted oxidoreductase